MGHDSHIIAFFSTLLFSQIGKRQRREVTKAEQRQNKSPRFHFFLFPRLR
jgi:hypothetical protein